jgi:hypothetical protein
MGGVRVSQHDDHDANGFPRLVYGGFEANGQPTFGPITIAQD